MTGEECERRLADAITQRDRMAEAMVALEQHAGMRLLATATLTGESMRRWRSAESAVRSLWEWLAAYGAMVDRASAVRARRSRLDPGLTSELLSLLTGTSVELVGEEIPLERRGLRGPERVVERVTPAALLDRMDAAYAEAIDTVVAADAVWSALVPRLDAIDAAQRSAHDRAEAVDAGLTANADRLAERVMELRQMVLSDPLSLWHDRRVDTDRLARIEAAAAALRREIDEVVRVAEAAESRIAAVAALVEVVAEVEADIRRLRERVLDRIAAAVVPDVPAESTVLRRRLAELDEPRRQRRWRELATRVTRLIADATAAADRARVVLADTGAPLGRRDELRGRLEAYRAKAGRLGRAESAALLPLYDEARTLAYIAPCDLEATTKAINRYQRAITNVATT